MYVLRLCAYTTRFECLTNTRTNDVDDFSVFVFDGFLLLRSTKLLGKRGRNVSRSFQAHFFHAQKRLGTCLNVRRREKNRKISINRAENVFGFQTRGTKRISELDDEFKRQKKKKTFANNAVRNVRAASQSLLPTTTTFNLINFTRTTRTVYF